MTTRTDIKRTLRHYKPALNRLGIRNLGLFGSFVSGKPTVESDIDILIDFYPEKENFDNYMAVCDLLQSIFEGKDVDIVTVNGLSKYIGPEILKEVEYV
jgi:uncharacterized protein